MLRTSEPASVHYLAALQFAKLSIEAVMR